MRMKEKKEKVYKIISILVFLVIFAIIYVGLDKLVERKESITKNGAFFQEENDFDVLFFGTSHMMNSVYPMELWKNYGIISYNMAGPNNVISASYWELINALDYTTPELVVVDLSTLGSKTKIVEGKLEHLHRTFDAFPLSKNKLKAIWDLIEPKDRIGFWWKFSLYHSRWSQLTEKDFNVDFSTGKGAGVLTRVAIPNEKAVVPKEQKIADDTVGVEYLCKMIELCQERDIDILLTYIPFPAGENKVKEANLGYDIAEKYGIEYLNLLDIDGVVDFDVDCDDSHSHLNASGARKVTDYLGNYIQENYHIKDRRDDEQYASWNKAYKDYSDYRIEFITKQTSLDSALMLHNDHNLNTCIYVKENSEILQDERMVKLIKNVSPYVEPVKLETAIQNGSEYFLVVDNGWCNIWESVGGEPLTELGTTFGSLSFEGGNGNGKLQIQDLQENRLVEGTDVVPDVQIITINRLTGEIVNRAAYTVDGNDDHGNIVAVKSN